MATEIKVYTGQRPVWLHCGRLLQALGTIMSYSYIDTCFFPMCFGCLCWRVRLLSNGMPSCTDCREEHRASTESSIKRQIRHLIKMVPENTKALNFKTGQMAFSRNVTWTCRKQMVGGLRDSLQHESTPQWNSLLTTIELFWQRVAIETAGFEVLKHDCANWLISNSVERDKLSFGFNNRVITPWTTADSSSASHEIASCYVTSVFVIAFTAPDQPSLSWPSLSQSTPSSFFKIHFITLSSLLRLNLQSDLIPPNFLFKTLYAYIFSPTRATYPDNFPLLDLINQIMFDEEHITKVLSMQFSLVSCSFLPLSPKHFISALCSNTVRLCSSLVLMDQAL